MSLSDSQVRAYKATDKRQKKSCGDSLFLVIEPMTEDGKGGGKSFVGRTRFPPGRGNPVVDVRIGVYGKGPGKWSLKEARDEWDLIRAWSKEHARDPRDRKREKQKAFIQQTNSPPPWRRRASRISLNGLPALSKGSGNTGTCSGTRSFLLSGTRPLWSSCRGTTSTQAERRGGS